MSQMSDYLENKLVDHILRNRSYTVPTTIYVALFTSAPNDNNTGTEVSGGSYVRQQVGPSDTAWTATQGGTPAAASSGTSGVTSNASTITFSPAPTASWGTVGYFGVYDALSGGNLLIWGSLTTPKTINNGDAAPTFPAGSLAFTFA
jgi:hypothetical protein